MIAVPATRPPPDRPHRYAALPCAATRPTAPLCRAATRCHPTVPAPILPCLRTRLSHTLSRRACHPTDRTVALRRHALPPDRSCLYLEHQSPGRPQTFPCQPLPRRPPSAVCRLPRLPIKLRTRPRQCKGCWRALPSATSGTTTAIAGLGRRPAAAAEALEAPEGGRQNRWRRQNRPKEDPCVAVEGRQRVAAAVAAVAAVAATTRRIGCSCGGRGCSS